VASEPLAGVIVAIDRVWEVVLLGSEENTEIIRLLENAKQCLDMQPPQVEAARRHLVDAKAELVSRGDEENAAILGEVLQRDSMRLG
jgi:hypothetical protein